MKLDNLKIIKNIFDENIEFKQYFSNINFKTNQEYFQNI